jgi:hypothetical protein
MERKIIFKPTQQSKIKLNDENFKGHQITHYITNDYSRLWEKEGEKNEKSERRWHLKLLRTLGVIVTDLPMKWLIGASNF